MLRRPIAVLTQAALAFGFLGLPFACLIQSSINDPWPWLGVMLGLILFSPLAAACGTGSVVSALRSGQPGHRSGMVAGYLTAMIGGSAIHIGLLFLYCSGQVDLDPAIALMTCAVIADVLLFLLGYRAGSSAKRSSTGGSNSSPRKS